MPGADVPAPARPSPGHPAPAPAPPPAPAGPAQPAQPAQPPLLRLRSALTRSSVETIVSRSSAGFAVLFAMPALPSIAASWGWLPLGWAVGFVLVVFVQLMVILVAAIARRGVRASMAFFALSYPILLVLWPLAITDTAAARGNQPWLWFLLDVAFAYAAVAFPWRWAAVYSVGVTCVYVFIRTVPAGGSASVGFALIDGFYVTLIGAFILMIVTSLRAAADRVDAAQVTATREYARAALNHASELERVKVDALVHDTVLTTLITAARAESVDERRRAVTLAQNSLDTLQHSAGVFGPTAVPLAQFAERLADAARLLSSRIDYSTGPLDERLLPAPVAEALYSAGVQALINSLQHAGGDATAGAGDTVSRTLSVHSESFDDVTVQVADTGVGFMADAVPPARLGLRVSVRERVHMVGGVVEVLSMPGGGTSIVLSWRPGTPS
ncbi:sensor histidine kinase [Subtercola vilae]|uniref:histidine kinase n=1 Tax=Subtercola vilae TaxID=2056433 RepID=A0A4T2C6B7_9MICO|nr:ATP-binding protein [Subtercola vilae]TIH37788.1 hypothetical protein D4765_07170 [Subtercola vilae]